jgi:predicted nucleic acid-binding protein
MVEVKSKFKIVREDPDDDMIVLSAYDSKARYIVSGDKHLLALKEFKGIRILINNEILNILNS